MILGVLWVCVNQASYIPQVGTEDNYIRRTTSQLRELRQALCRNQELSDYLCNAKTCHLNPSLPHLKSEIPIAAQRISYKAH